MKSFKYLLNGVAFLILFLTTIYTGYRLAFRNLILPNVQIANINVSGMDEQGAESLVRTYFESHPNEVVLIINGEEVSNLSSLVVKHDYTWAANQAYNVGRNGNILTQIKEQISALVRGRTIEVPLDINRDELTDLVGQVAEDNNLKPIWPSLGRTNNEVALIKGTDGVLVQTDRLVSEIFYKLSLPGKHLIEVPREFVSVKENEELVASAVTALDKWGRDPLRLHFRDFDYRVEPDELIKLFGLISNDLNDSEFEKLVDNIKPKVEVEAKDAVFIFEDGKVKEFSPEVVGAVIDIPRFYEELAVKLKSAEEKSLEIPTISSYPKIAAGDINDLGIKELLGTGKSVFAHSIPGRVFNVNLAASRVNGTIVAPGEEFSFNDAVGEISKGTGYQTAYIISQGRTVLGDGGGVCQVSTTTFRAALAAGLPITERKAHAYRVGYYEQDSAPGIDATIFYPTADLKFLNDTGNHILIQQTVDTKNFTMRVDIYGTSDGRVSTITKPRVSSQSAPPAPLYVDDPTLQAGVLKQVDWAAWGAKVAFDYKVERGGEVVYEKTFVSNYRPWQAVYMRGTGEVASR